MTAAISETSLPKVILHYVQQQYEHDGTGLLLARLGLTLTQQHSELKAQLGKKKLAEFLAKKMASEVKVVVSPHDSKVFIVLPAHVDVTGDTTRYFPQQRAAAPINAPVIPRYNRAVWAAFSQPLNQNCHRFLSLEPIISYSDSLQATATDGAIPIEAQSIVSADKVADPGQHAKKIAENIEAWSKLHHVATSLLLASAKHPAGGSSGADKLSLLDILMSALDESELKRIQLPLDIVAKLHRSKR